MQAEGHDSDCMLRPVDFITDPFRGEGNYLVLCEVYFANGTVHSSNSRAQLRKILDNGAAKLEAWAGYEQEYTIFEGRNPLGWPENGFPAPQGPYYCGVGTRQIFGREFAEEHTRLCLDAGVIICGINAEVMPGQWEFQIGYRGIDEDVSVLRASDHLWYARWIAHRLSEEFGYHISIENKPVKGDWNGTGLHTNFSTKDIRDSKKGKKAIEAAITALSKKHKEHIALYGEKLEERLTGKHETSSMSKFSDGKGNRGSSVRLPLSVAQKGYGYFEDRRPGANADPYLIGARLLCTIAGVEEKHFTFQKWLLAE
jgi:glutamine synthetase